MRRKACVAAHQSVSIRLYPALCGAHGENVGGGAREHLGDERLRLPFFSELDAHEAKKPTREAERGDDAEGR